MHSFKTQIHGIRSRRPKGSVIIKVECLLKRSHCDEERKRRAERSSASHQAVLRYRLVYVYDINLHFATFDHLHFFKNL